MARPKATELRNLSDNDLIERINSIRHQLFDLRFKQATRQLANTHHFKQARIKLAQLLTVQEERSSSSTNS